MAVLRRQPASTPKSKPVAFPGLSSQPARQGHLRLSLISCAVGLYKATRVAGDISFNLINCRTGNRIKMITRIGTRACGPLDFDQRYAMEKSNYVLFSEKDFESVKLETTKTLEIERFVNADTIDRLC
jgi:DNA end-binding protein Ku